MSSRRFRVDPQRVVHETIDGETILIHLKTGAYFSLSGSGPEIWSLLVDGWSDEAAVSELARRYPDSDESADATRAFVRELVREELLEEADAAGEEPPGAELPSGRAFEPPKVQKYTDMQYFLLLDPIHEVEAAGWPHERGQEPAPVSAAD
jgi:Coenzyme PQQ synthesis protein D (PqqD)